MSRIQVTSPRLTRSTVDLDLALAVEGDAAVVHGAANSDHCVADRHACGRHDEELPATDAFCEEGGCAGEEIMGC